MSNSQYMLTIVMIVIKKKNFSCMLSISQYTECFYKDRKKYKTKNPKMHEYINV